MAGLETTLPASMEDAEASVRTALAEQGFGVLTEMDVAATLKAKIDVDRPPLKVLGACHPTLANRALEIDDDASLFLPCNVVLQAIDAGTRVRAVDPHELMPDTRLADVADEVAERLAAAIDALD
jgi:uncharacterized protein (DUF302 family)